MCLSSPNLAFSSLLSSTHPSSLILPFNFNLPFLLDGALCSFWRCTGKVR